jgi:hypothetical protein
MQDKKQIDIRLKSFENAVKVRLFGKETNQHYIPEETKSEANSAPWSWLTSCKQHLSLHMNDVPSGCPSVLNEYARKVSDTSTGQETIPTEEYVHTDHVSPPRPSGCPSSREHGSLKTV